jgi:hypothetical protein
MKTIQKITDNAAWERYVRIKQLMHQSKTLMLVVAAELYEFQKLRQYMPLGYDTFEAFLADPDIDIARRTAYRLIRIYKKYILELGCATDALIEAGPSKLDEMASYVTEENKMQLLNTASTLSRSDLQVYLTHNEKEYTESWRHTLREARTLCERLASDQSAPLEIREYANDFVSQTKPTVNSQSSLV